MFDKKGMELHPILVIMAAAVELGWHTAVEKDGELIRGLCVGTKEYMDSVLKVEKKS